MTARLLILIIEDNPVQQRLYKILCQRHGCEAIVYDSVEEAAVHLDSASELPALVFLDCQLNGKSSLPHVTLLKQAAVDRCMVLPVVAITAHAFESDRVQCLEAGVDDYLAKPFTLEQFNEMIGRWLPVQSQLTVA